MVVEKLFIAYRRPRRICLIGEGRWDCFQINGNRFQRIHSVATTGMLGVPAREENRLRAVLGNREWGVVLRSDSFIFNIFDFERLPFREKSRRDVTEWRLQKIFPEDISRFDHRVFPLGRNRVLSVLLPVAERERLTAWFRERNIPLIFMGNSTMELMNHLWRHLILPWGKEKPKILVEIDHNLVVVVFQEKMRPYYIRKFRCESSADFMAEMRKTREYVRSNYHQEPESVGYFPGTPAFEFSGESSIWKELGLRRVASGNRATAFLWGSE